MLASYIVSLLALDIDFAESNKTIVNYLWWLEIGTPVYLLKLLRWLNPTFLLKICVACGTTTLNVKVSDLPIIVAMAIL